MQHKLRSPILRISDFSASPPLFRCKTMEFPFGHHHHHHHHHPERRPDEEEEQRYPEPEYPPPPSEYERPYSHPQPEFHRPPPPPAYERPPTEPPAYGISGYERPPYGYDAPPQFPQESPNYAPPPYGSVQHVSHELRPDAEPQRPHHHGPFSHMHHHSHEGGLPEELSRKPTVRVFCQAGERYSLAIRDGNLILAESDPNDPYQHWIKDEKFSTRVKDEQSFPSFALVNKVTGQALKHSIGATHPVRLWPHNPNVLDESVLWTESRDAGNGFRAIRMVNNIRLNLDAFHGDKDHGGVHDGTTLVLWEWTKGDNQKWKIIPY